MHVPERHLLGRAIGRLRGDLSGLSRSGRRGVAGPGETAGLVSIAGLRVASGRDRLSDLLGLAERGDAVPPSGPAGGFIDLPGLRRAGLVGFGRLQHRVGDELRRVQARVGRRIEELRADAHPAANRILLTSAHEGEGKSFAALNLAAGLARFGAREVVLVDLDRGPAGIGDRLGVDDLEGFGDLDDGRGLDPRSLLLDTPVPRLALLPRGADRDTLETAIPLADRVRALGEALADRILVFDASPCLAGSDPALIAPQAGQVILVVEAERTQRHELDAALGALPSDRNVSLLLNKTRFGEGEALGRR